MAPDSSHESPAPIPATDGSASAPEVTDGTEIAEFVGKAEDILRPFLRDPQQAHQAAIRVISTVEMFRGPLPHPKHLEEYERIIPGGAKEILSMAMREQSHRHWTSRLTMLYPYVGLGVGGVCFLACIAAATWLGMAGHEGLAAVFLGVPVAGVIGWFVKARIDTSPGG